MAKTRPITGLDSQAPTTTNARIILQQRLEEMYAYTPYIENPDNTQELHDMRIAAKRMRYTLELFEEFLPTSSKNFAEELSRLQNELGALHDSEVMLTLLRQLLLQEQAHPAPMQNEEDGSDSSRSTLLPPAMTRALLHPTHAPALSTRERQGLQSFLHRQEQRREQAYALFRQHWETLERKQFRAELLSMLNSEW